ncbi:MAG: hypothetical protein AAGF11_06775 [Myxococcota bacterium]
MSEADIEIVELRGVTVYLSAEHFPVLIPTWFGNPSVPSVERFIDWLDRMAARAKQEGTKVVLMGDLTQAQRPSPEVRRALAHALDRFHGRNGDGFLGGSTIIGQPLMRAVVIMVLALTRTQINFRPVKSLAAAFERTRRLLDAAGIAWPEGLDPDTYERPKPPKTPQ